MKVFIDSNVLLDDFYQRKGAEASREVQRFCVSSPAHEAWVAWHTLSNAFYIVRGHASSKDVARSFISDLLQWVEVAETTKSDALKAISYGMSDFEDALQLAAAEACAADVLITRNTKDFKASTIPVMTPEEFLAAHGPQTTS